MRAWAATVILIAGTGAARANSGGFTGASGKPGSGSCIDCHGGGVPKSVELTGPKSLGAGETGTYVVVITSASPGKQKHGGVDVAASAGTLKVRPSSPSSTKLAGGEIVQDKTAGPADPIKFEFDFTAPSSGGPVTLFAAGLSADGNGTLAGDGAKTTMLMVDVIPPDLAGTAIDIAGIDLFGVPPPDLAVPPEPDLAGTIPDLAMVTPIPAGEPRWGCGCALGATVARADLAGSAKWALALLAFTVAARRRTRIA